MSVNPTFAISGHITRLNLTPSQTPLPILVDPYWPLLGDDEDAADMSMEAGINPAQSKLKAVWANSPYVAGQQLVLAVPDNSKLALRLVVDGADMVSVQSSVASIIQAIRTQIAFQVSITLQTATYTWNCYTGTYLVSFNQLFYFGYLLPIYLTIPRTPIPVSGPV